MQRDEFRGISYDDPRLQARFEALLSAVDAAEHEREPIRQRYRQAEREDGVSRALDDQLIGANNKIAAAKRAVDAFLAENRDYNVQR